MAWPLVGRLRLSKATPPPRFAFADGRLHSRRSPSVHPGRPRRGLGRNSSPPSRRGTITRSSPCWPACRNSPSAATSSPFLQHCHVVRRVLEIGKWLALGHTAPAPASLHPPLGTPTPAPAVTGRYVPVTAGGTTYQIYYEQTGNGAGSAVPAHRRRRRAAVPPPDGRSAHNRVASDGRLRSPLARQVAAARRRNPRLMAARTPTSMSP